MKALALLLLSCAPAVEPDTDISIDGLYIPGRVQVLTELPYELLPYQYLIDTEGDVFELGRHTYVARSFGIDVIVIVIDPYDAPWEDTIPGGIIISSYGYLKIGETVLYDYGHIEQR